MTDYEKQYFNVLLHMATERFVERVIQRQEGAKKALQSLRKDPYGEGIWLDQFIDAFFEEFLLNNLDGYSFILQALANREYDVMKLTMNETTVEKLLEIIARDVFEQLLLQKVEEALEQNLVFGE